MITVICVITHATLPFRWIRQSPGFSIIHESAEREQRNRPDALSDAASKTRRYNGNHQTAQQRYGYDKTHHARNSAAAILTHPSFLLFLAHVGLSYPIPLSTQPLVQR